MTYPRILLVQVTPNSAEKIALELLERVALMEWKRIGKGQEYRTEADREWLLDAYAECLLTAKGLRSPRSTVALTETTACLDPADCG